MTKHDALSLDPGQQAVILTRDEVMMIQVALSFQGQELQRAHNRAIEAGADYRDLRPINAQVNQLTDLNNALATGERMI